MTRFLLLLLAVLALPTAVNAESYWLVIQTSAMQALSLEKIEMASMEQCKEEGVNLKVETQNTIATLAWLVNKWNAYYSLHFY